MSGRRWAWLAVWAALIVADAYTTETALTTGYIDEGNPAAAWILATFGLRAMLLAGAAACLAVAAAPLAPWPTPLLRRAVWAVAWLALAVKVAVVASNLAQLAT